MGLQALTALNSYQQQSRFICLKRDFYESSVQKMVAQVLEMVPRALEMIPQASEMVAQASEMVAQALEMVPRALEMIPQALEMVPQISETIPQTPVGTKFVQDQLFVKVRAMDSRRLF